MRPHDKRFEKYVEKELDNHYAEKDAPGAPEVLQLVVEDAHHNHATENDTTGGCGSEHELVYHRSAVGRHAGDPVGSFHDPEVVTHRNEVAPEAGNALRREDGEQCESFGMVGRAVDGRLTRRTKTTPVARMPVRGVHRQQHPRFATLLAHLGSMAAQTGSRAAMARSRFEAAFDSRCQRPITMCYF